jgi:hypothetical protein
LSELEQDCILNQTATRQTCSKGIPGHFNDLVNQVLIL